MYTTEQIQTEGHVSQILQGTVPTHDQARFSGKHCVVASVRDDAPIISPLYDTPEQAQAAQAELKSSYAGAVVAFWPTRADWQRMCREDESGGLKVVVRMVDHSHSVERRFFPSARATSLEEAISIAEAEGFEPIPVAEGGQHYCDPHTDLIPSEYVVTARPETAGQEGCGHE